MTHVEKKKKTNLDISLLTMPISFCLLLLLTLTLTFVLEKIGGRLWSDLMVLTVLSAAWRTAFHGQEGHILIIGKSSWQSCCVVLFYVVLTSKLVREKRIITN